MLMLQRAIWVECCLRWAGHTTSPQPLLVQWWTLLLCFPLVVNAGLQEARVQAIIVNSD